MSILAPGVDYVKLMIFFTNGSGIKCEHLGEGGTQMFATPLYDNCRE